MAQTYLLAAQATISDIFVGVYEVWLDGTDEDTEGVWLWSSNGQQLAYDNWGATEPQNNIEADGSSENCLAVITTGSNLWESLLCTYWRPSVCENRIHF